MVRNEEMNHLYETTKVELKNNNPEWENHMKKVIELIIADCITNHDDKFIGFFLSKMNREYDNDFQSYAGVYIKDASLYITMNFMMMVNALSIKDIIDIITHEVYHIVMNHLGRGNYDYDKEAANMAMDTAINQFINFSEDLYKVICTPESIKEEFDIKQTIELKKEYDYYYDLIINSPNYNKKKKERQENSQFLQDLIDEINRRLNDGSSSGNGNNSNNTQNGNNSSNSSSSNGKNDFSNKTLKELLDILEDFIKNNKVTVTHKNWSKLSPLDRETAKETIRGMLQEAKNRGIVPSNLSNMIDDMYFKEPIISWKSELRYTIGSVPVPYRKTMRVKNRRQPSRADILGRVPDRKIKIAVALDTSGSVNDNEIKYFFNEVFNIIKDTKTEITLIECDSMVQSVFKLKDKNDLRRISINGRGGTYFTPVFEYIRDVKKIEYPDILIFFTDGCGENEISMNLKPRCEIMWILTGNNEKNLSVRNPFTNKVRLLNIEGKKFH